MSNGLTLNVELSQESREKLRRLEDAGGLLAALATAMNAQANYTVSHIHRTRLIGTGPFPPSEHKLGVRSSRLWKALFATRATISGKTISWAIGDSVKYARIHELGGTIKHAARSGSVRLRTDARGNLLRQSGDQVGGRLAVFAKRSHKRARVVQYQAAAYQVNMPARAPIWTGILDCSAELRKAVVTTTEKFLLGK
jgi:hypothetical protein